MSFERYPEIIFASSTNNFGNMSIRKEDPQIVIQRRKHFLETLGLKLEDTVWTSLTHGTDVAIASNKDKGKGSENPDTYLNCDVVITNQPGIFLAEVTGDCIPMGLYDPTTKSLALVHASIHNLPKNVLRTAIDSLVREYGSKPADILVEFGPSICPNCYKPLYLEITPPELHVYLTKLNSKEYSINLWQLAKDRLLAAGIKEENITNPSLEICTYHTGKYFSHRQFVEENLPKDFRFATILGLKQI